MRNPEFGKICRWLTSLSLSWAVAVLWSLTAWAAPFVPTSDDQVLEWLPAEPALRELSVARAALRRQPQNLQLAVQLASRYVELGRINGDPRYAGYAQAVLRPWWELAQPPHAVLLLRATLRQRVHDFPAALADLSTLLATDPRNGQARLTRATILQVQGEFDAAAKDCAVLKGAGNELVSAACTLSVSGATGRLRESYDELKRVLARNPQTAADVRAWLLSIMAEMAARAGLGREAEAHFREALKLDATDHYILGAYADNLLDAGRANEVVKLLDGSLRTDGLLLRNTLALKAIKSSELPAQVELLRSRFAASRLRGDLVHQREEARFALHVLSDPDAALRLAKENWEVQKELADARILLEAALAANDKATVQSTREWVARVRMQDVQLRRLLGS